jgi:hypothetical protein
MALSAGFWTIAVSRYLLRPGEGTNPMLEWRPRLIAMLVVVALVASVLVTGYFDLIVDNWEW